MMILTLSLTHTRTHAQTSPARTGARAHTNQATLGSMPPATAANLTYKSPTADKLSTFTTGQRWSFQINFGVAGSHIPSPSPPAPRPAHIPHSASLARIRSEPSSHSPFLYPACPFRPCTLSSSDHPHPHPCPLLFKLYPVSRGGVALNAFFPLQHSPLPLPHPTNML
jgi:hypothetical protein